MKPRRRVRLGVIGLGNIAQRHFQNVRSGLVADCELTALCSRTPPKLMAASGIPHFIDHRALVASGLCDAVLIATPTFSHFEIGAAALQAGLHVMMEKPIGLSVQEGENLLALQQDGQVFALMLNQRVDPLFIAMRESIQSGALGNITRTQWTMTNWFRPEIYFQVSEWRATWRGEGGGLLVNQCIHNLDTYQWLCGMPRSVRACCRFGRYHDIEVEDEVTAYFEYENGATGVFVGSTGEAPGINRLDVVGDKGTLSFDGERLLLTRIEPSASQFSRKTHEMFGLPNSSVSDITPDRVRNQHAEVLTNFCAAIVNGDPLIAPAADGINSLAVANGMLLSTWEQAEIALPLDKRRYQQALEARIADSRFRQKTDEVAHVDMDASFR
jgi:predicted dehydrogenase